MKAFSPKWIMRIHYSRSLASITLPTVWMKQYKKPGDRHMYIEIGEPGELIVMTEERYAEKRIQRNQAV